MKKTSFKKILFIILLVLFLPFAIFTLIKGEFGWFFGGALIVYIIIKIANKRLE